MPKKTFFNLPSQKQNFIIETSLRKFASLNYTAASLSQIVKETGIAKGSMYQYFEDKKELYIYLVNYANDMKFDFISEEAEPQDEFFSFYRELIRAGSLFDLTHPLISRFQLNVMQQPSAIEGENNSELLSNRLGEFIENLIHTAKEHNHIADYIDPVMATFVVNLQTMNFFKYLNEKYNLSLEKNLENKEYPLPLPMETVEMEVDNLVKLVEVGLRWQKA